MARCLNEGQSILKIYFNSEHYVSICGCVHMYVGRCLSSPASDSLGARLSGGCQPSDVGAGGTEFRFSARAIHILNC